MALIRITLTKQCPLSSGMAYNSYLQDDVYYDKYGFPVIPSWVLRSLLLKTAKTCCQSMEASVIDSVFNGSGPESLYMDDAMPAFYYDMRHALQSNLMLPYDSRMVLNMFSSVVTSNADGKKVRVRELNAGTVFECYFTLGKEWRKTFEEIVDNMHSLLADGTDGVRAVIDWEAERPYTIPQQQKNIVFGSTEETLYEMTYTLFLLSDTFLRNADDQQNNSLSYIPGNEIHEVVMKILGTTPEDFDPERKMNFSFAFVDVDGRRGMPTPMSFSTKKLDKKQLCDRLSKGRLPDDNEQICSMSSSYCTDRDAATVKTRKVVMTKGMFVSPEGSRTIYSAIAAEQAFRGTIIGTEAQLRKITEALNCGRFISIGKHQSIGFGRAYMSIDGVREYGCNHPIMVNAFTLDIVSPLILKNDAGLYYEDNDALLQELEKKIGGNVRLKINTIYKSCIKTAQWNVEWNASTPVILGLKPGSTARISSLDGNMFDISRIMHTYLGCNNDDGYGEIAVHPVVDIYYRKIVSASDHVEKTLLPIGNNGVEGEMFVKRLSERYCKVLATCLGQNDAENVVRFIIEAKMLMSDITDSEPDVDSFVDDYLAGLSTTCKYLLKHERQ